ncbi:fatty acyl CoA synthetase [Lysobacteraceae bacterium NML07-0707]|nr:fatty acyl CoA synthetase [Xanthomonadaceae bacterium NML07-0707]
MQIKPRRRMTLPCSAVLCAAALLAPMAQAGSNIDSDWILARLARPAPMQTDFVELRSSRLLKKPLRISGQYRRPDENTLVREVRAPYAEVTTIGQGQVSIARGNGQTRRVPLARVPQLAGIQASFGALLAGDAATIKRSFALQTQGSREAWQMRMTPNDAAMKQHLQDITLHGRGMELRCIETRAVAGEEVQRTLLASAARTLPANASDAQIRSLCHNGS